MTYEGSHVKNILIHSYNTFSEIDIIAFCSLVGLADVFICIYADVKSGHLCPSLLEYFL